jgi:hypothetical protein
MLETVITAGGLSSLILEVIKLLFRLTKPDFDFPTKFYVVALPVLNVLVIPLMALLTVEGYTMPTEWLEFGKEAARVFLASLISVVTYVNVVSPLKVNAERNED